MQQDCYPDMQFERERLKSRFFFGHVSLFRPFLYHSIVTFRASGSDMGNLVHALPASATFNFLLMSTQIGLIACTVITGIIN